MRIRIRHVTRFSYDQPAYESHNEARLQPAENSTQQCLSFELTVDPEAAIFASKDYFGNHVHSISVAPRHESLTIVAESTVERLPADLESIADMSFTDFLREDSTRGRSMYEFLNPSRYVPFSGRLRKFFWSSRPAAEEGVADYVTRTLNFIRDQFEYETGTTDVHSDSDRMLTTGGGVCQDFAHLSIGVLRLAGVPARYVSGYLAENIASEFPLREQASHAWLEAWLPTQGWTGFDPTHRCRTNQRHVTVAIGRDYADVPPLRGIYRSAGKKQAMSINIDIEPVGDAVPGNGVVKRQSQQQ